MQYEATGFISKIGEVQSFGTKGFKKREIVLEIPDGKFPQTVAFEFQGERAELPEKYNIGDEITVKFDLKGRLHQPSGRVYNTLNAWQIKGDSTPPKPDAPLSKQGLAQTSLNPKDDESVPF